MNELKVFENTPIDPTVLLYSLAGLIFLIALIVYGTYRYQRFKKFREFSDEMIQLDLNSDEENTLGGMVKRYAMQEPVQVLFSLRLFDEMATKEINRVLGSAASHSTKQKFVDIVYEIRKKTYFHDWMIVPETEGEESELQEELMVSSEEASA